jgi:hypothetical protein
MGEGGEGGEGDGVGEGRGLLSSMMMPEPLRHSVPFHRQPSGQTGGGPAASSGHVSPEADGVAAGGVSEHAAKSARSVAGRKQEASRCMAMSPGSRGRVERG